MSLRTKFGVAFVLIAALVTALAMYSVHALTRNRDLVVRLYDEPLMAVNYARRASATMNEARRQMDRILSFGPASAPGAVVSLDAMEREIKDDLRVVRERVHNQDVADGLRRAQGAIADWFQEGRLVADIDGDGLTAIPISSDVEGHGQAAIAALDDVVELVAANGFDYRTRAQAALKTSSATLLALGGGIIAVSAFFVLGLAHLLIRPIGVATGIAESVAADKACTIARSGRRDEIGRLLNCLATTQFNLRAREDRTQALLAEKDQAAAALEQTNLRFDTALSNMGIGLIMLDGQGEVVVANRRFFEIFGVSPDGLPAQPSYRDLVALASAAGNYSGDAAEEVIAEYAGVLHGRHRITAVRKIAAERLVNVSYEPMPGGGSVVTYEDITERSRTEEQIVFLARHDILTGLPNRLIFRHRLDQALRTIEDGSSFALLCLDLDRFKSVNDTLGHHAGDAVLRAVAGRLADAVRDGDTVARLGGDEFAILQLGVSSQADVALLAGHVIAALTHPFDVCGQPVSIGVSIGIAMAPDHASSGEDLIRNADLALFRAKQGGRGGWRMFEPAMDAVAKSRRELGNDLRDAIALGQLEVHYQPIVSCRTRVLSGFEALLRWRHPTRGIVSPTEFIPIAEATGLIVPIGAWVLERACEEAMNWPDDVRVAVNLSPLQFRDGTLVETVSATLRSSGLPPKRLELEITETALLQDDQATLATLHAIRALGPRIALDDFGTGYSSLSYLRSFPFDTIKIDRSFVGDLMTRDDCETIVRSIIGLGSSLNMHVTAEGIENAGQFEFLVDAGCTEMQGYLFSKPLPAASLAVLIGRLSKPFPQTVTTIAKSHIRRLDWTRQTALRAVDEHDGSAHTLLDFLAMRQAANDRARA